MLQSSKYHVQMTNVVIGSGARKLTAPGTPRQYPIHVLTRPDLHSFRNQTKSGGMAQGGTAITAGDTSPDCICACLSCEQYDSYTVCNYSTCMLCHLSSIKPRGLHHV